jgi:DDE superfamily endonuclease
LCSSIGSIDESGINKCLRREHARSSIGSKIYGATSRLKYARESFIAAKIQFRILAPFCYTGTYDAKFFNLWLKEFLISDLKEGQVVIMDNASFHKSRDSQEIIPKAGCKILFLSSYSPNLNQLINIF